MGTDCPLWSPHHCPHLPTFCMEDHLSTSHSDLWVKNLCIAKSEGDRLGMSGNEESPCQGALEGCPGVGTELFLRPRRPRAPGWE